MADLYPTPTRLELLRGVQRKEVTAYRFNDGRRDEYYWDGQGGGKKATGRIEEMLKAGWLVTVLKPFGKTLTVRKLELTDAGRQVLEGASGV